ncbi:alpha/beta hydrolase [Acidianus sp. DSM 29099]|nr:alpha/beta hydrolase [Acidianus sp. RZ1]
MKHDIMTIESESLKDNFLKDPYVRELHIYTPDQLDEGLPLFIELAGINWSRNTSNRFHHIMHNLLDKEKIKAIVVNPDFRTKYSMNQYINSPAVGNYEDFIINELIPQVREKYGTGNVALFGKSSGGFGSFTLAVKHPDIVNGFADHFGDSCFFYLYAQDFVYAVKYLHDKDVRQAISELISKEPNDDEMRVLNVLGSSAFYSYNVKKECGFDLPFTCSGEIVEDVWKRWIANDPVKTVSNYRDELRKMKAIYLDVGKNDEYNLFIGMRTLHKKMENLGITHFFEEFDGGHFGNSTRYCKSLPYLYEKLVDS